MEKILFIVTQGCFGGAQRYVYDLAANLSSDYKIVVASGTESLELEKILTSSSIRWQGLRHLRRSIHPLHDLLAIAEIFRLIKKEQPDIVHLNSSKAGVVGSIAAKLAGVRQVVFTMHGLVLEEPLSVFKKIFYFLAEKLSAHFKDFIIAVSEADRKAALRYRLKTSQKIITIHNGINLERVSMLSKDEARRELANALGASLEQKKLIGVIADFYPTKGLEFFIEAVRVLSQNPHYHFIIIGRSGPNKLSIEKSVIKNRLNSILSIISLPQPSRLIKAFDAFVISSIKEGLPYNLLEACAAVVPIVATAVGGIPEVISNNTSGLLIPAGNSAALSAAIDQVIGNEDLAKRLSLGARAAVTNFTLAQMVKETKKVYSTNKT